MLNNIELIYRPFALCKLQTCYNHVIIIYSNFRSWSFDIYAFLNLVFSHYMTISYEISQWNSYYIMSDETWDSWVKKCSGWRLALILFPWFDRVDHIAPPSYIIHLHKTRDDPFLTWGHQNILQILHSKSIGVIIFYLKIGKSFQINWKENWKKNMETSEVDIWHSKKFLEQHMFQR